MGVEEFGTVEDLALFKPQGDPLFEDSFGDYTVRTYREWESGIGCFEIHKDGRRVYASTGYWFHVGDRASYYGPAASPNGMTLRTGDDVTGDGKPNVVIWEEHGGNHGGQALHVFELGDELRTIAYIDRIHGAHYVDLDGDADLELIAFDDVFAYWHECGAGSPRPQVILRYRDGRYRMASELMLQPPPPREELDQLAKSISFSSGWWVYNPKRTPQEFVMDLLQLKVFEQWRYDTKPSELWGGYA